MKAKVIEITPGTRLDRLAEQIREVRDSAATNILEIGRCLIEARKLIAHEHRERNLERAKGTEPSYAAWEARRFSSISKA
jgi:hypothetical protein